MSDLNSTPSANRIHIAFFGLRNAGKSTLVNAFTNQNIAIVSDVAGTTTDPVSKAMEILPLGPCLITDTAGLDDVGELGAMRVEKTLAVLATTDVAVWVWGGEKERTDEVIGPYHRVAEACVQRKIALLEYRRGESVEGLKQKIAALKLVDETPGLLDGLVAKGDQVVCVCPIDESAPKGRLILPQVQVIRDCLDRHLACTVCQVEELREVLERLRSNVEIDGGGSILVITDSQAFKEVAAVVARCRAAVTAPVAPRIAPATQLASLGGYEGSDGTVLGRTVRLTSFSILFARQKGDLTAYKAGLSAIANLKDGDRVLIAEGCTHHRQCNDIGAVKIPKALAKLTGGKKLELEFASGMGFSLGEATPRGGAGTRLIVQCGGCMLTRREVLRRIALAREAGIPIVNYGMLLATAAGVEVEKCVM